MEICKEMSGRTIEKIEQIAENAIYVKFMGGKVIEFYSKRDSITTSVKDKIPDCAVDRSLERSTKPQIISVGPDECIDASQLPDGATWCVYYDGRFL